MKGGLTLFASLLVLGLCSGMSTRTSSRDTENQAMGTESMDDQQRFLDSEKSKPTVWNNELMPAGSQDAQSSGSDNSTTEGHHTLLETGEEIKDYLGKKISQLYDLLRGRKNKEEVEKALTISSDELPTFPEPYEIHDLYKNYKLAYMNFTNIHVAGMSGFKQSELRTNLEETSAKLVLKSDSLVITGNYSMSNILKHAAGAFKVTLKDVTYTESDIYHKNANEIDIVTSEVTVRYEKMENYFQDIGFFTQVFDSVITNQLLEDVLPEIGKEVGHLMRTTLLTRLRTEVLGMDNQKMINALEEIVRSAVSEARNLLKKGRYAALQLGYEPVDVQYKELQAQILSVYLSGLHTFEVVQLTPKMQGNKIRIDIQVKTGMLAGYATVLVLNKENSKWTVAYNIDDMSVRIAFEKELYNDDAMFDIVQLDVQVQKLETVLDKSHPEPYQSLFKEQVPKSLVPVINKRLAQMAKASIEEILHEGKMQTERKKLKSFHHKRTHVL
jgi:hypothetical protein